MNELYVVDELEKFLQRLYYRNFYFHTLHDACNFILKKTTNDQHLGYKLHYRMSYDRYSNPAKQVCETEFKYAKHNSIALTYTEFKITDYKYTYTVATGPR